VQDKSRPTKSLLQHCRQVVEPHIICQEPAEGMGLQAEGPDDQAVNLVITAVQDESITVDGNHPLAGKTLNFDIELVSID
jgi:FKBP-type peptidyl-prolyl cis-trans isomerase 2